MRYQLADLRFSSDAELPELTAASYADEPEVHIIWHSPAPLRVAPAFSAWQTPFGAVWLSFAAVDEGFLLTFEQWGQFLLSADAARVDVYPAPTTPAFTLRHLLLNQVVPLVLSRRSRLVLHASAVSWQQRVLAFVGRSGLGKSTIAAACAAHGARVVADDCLVLRRAGDLWLAWPYEASLRLWPDAVTMLGWPTTAGTPVAHFTEKQRVSLGPTTAPGETAALPLAILFDMEPHDVHARVSGREALKAVASNVFRFDVRDNRETRAQFEELSDLVSALPMHTLAKEAPLEAAWAVLCRMGQR